MWHRMLTRLCGISVTPSDRLGRSVAAHLKLRYSDCIEGRNKRQLLVSCFFFVPAVCRWTRQKQPTLQWVRAMGACRAIVGGSQVGQISRVPVFRSTKLADSIAILDLHPWTVWNLGLNPM